MQFWPPYRAALLFLRPDNGAFLSSGDLHGHDFIPAIAGFALVATITPGPNNIMIMASGLNFGFRQTAPFMFGVLLGFLFMILLSGAGLMTLFDIFPALTLVLKTASVIYILFLAWKIATSAVPEADARVSQPLTFLQGAAFQWVNPKAWAMGFTAISLYAPDHSFMSIALIGVAFTVIGMPALSLWAVTGIGLRQFLSNTFRLRIFNFIMALLLIAALYPAVFL